MARPVTLTPKLESDHEAQDQLVVTLLLRCPAEVQQMILSSLARSSFNDLKTVSLLHHETRENYLPHLFSSVRIDRHSEEKFLSSSNLPRNRNRDTPDPCERRQYEKSPASFLKLCAFVRHLTLVDCCGVEAFMLALSQDGSTTQNPLIPNVKYLFIERGVLETVLTHPQGKTLVKNLFRLATHIKPAHLCVTPFHPPLPNEGQPTPGQVLHHGFLKQSEHIDALAKKLKVQSITYHDIREIKPLHPTIPTQTIFYHANHPPSNMFPPPPFDCLGKGRKQGGPKSYIRVYGWDKEVVMDEEMEGLYRDFDIIVLPEDVKARCTCCGRP